ncbi:MAG: bifunctional RNase H/acid phosphatase [Actinomycetota bacterium]|nr:bifunctional RNase H/acid phosphatase [Actinomycetota bacterium]
MADGKVGPGGRPAVESVIVTADGGSRGNPGPAGYGATVIDAAGTVLAERAAGLGVTTNNAAEYSGLIAGLQAATELGASTVDVRVDSKLVVEQLSGRWKVKHPDLRPLAARAAELVAGFDRVTFTWVPRTQNSHADRLANEAMDAQADGRRWEPAAQLPPDPVSRGRSAEPAAASRHLDPAAGPPSVQALPPGARPGSTTLLVVRHGQSSWGAENRFAGREDVPLTEEGEAEADAVAARLSMSNVSAVITSPLQRCRRTAEIIAEATGLTSAAVTQNDDLLDGTLGEWTGFTAAEIAEKWPSEFEAWRSDPDAAPPGGESFSMIRDRVRAAVRGVLDGHRGGTVVLVTHAAAVKMLVIAALGVPSAVAYRTRIDNCSISMITVDVDGSTMVCSVNDTGHLA